MGSKISACRSRSNRISTLYRQVKSWQIRQVLKAALLANPLVIARIVFYDVGDDGILDELIDCMEKFEFIIGGGSIADSMFIVTSGSFRLADTDNKEVSAVVSIGDRGLISCASRSSTVTCTTDVVAYKLSRKDFDSVFSKIEKRRVISQVPVFATVDKPVDLQYICKHSRIVSFAPGEKILSRISSSVEYFGVVLSGSVEKRCRDVVETCRTHEYFGHEAFLQRDNHHRQPQINVPHSSQASLVSEVVAATGNIVEVIAKDNTEVLLVDQKGCRSRHFQAVRQVIQVCDELNRAHKKIRDILRAPLLQNSIFFKKLEFLGSPDSDEIEILLDKMECVTAEAKTRLYNMVMLVGDMPDALYVIESGSVQLVDEGFKIDRANPGQWFGDEALMTRPARITTATTAEYCKIYKLHQHDYYHAVEEVRRKYEFHRLPLFVSLDNYGAISYLFKHSRLALFNHGEMVLRSQDLNTYDFYVVLSGSVEAIGSQLQLSRYDSFGVREGSLTGVMDAVAPVDKFTEPEQLGFDITATGRQGTELLIMDSDAYWSPYFEYIREPMRDGKPLAEVIADAIAIDDARRKSIDDAKAWEMSFFGAAMKIFEPSRSDSVDDALGTCGYSFDSSALTVPQSALVASAPPVSPVMGEQKAAASDSTTLFLGRQASGSMVTRLDGYFNDEADDGLKVQLVYHEDDSRVGCIGLHRGNYSGISLPSLTFRTKKNG